MTANDSARPVPGTVFNSRQVRILKAVVIVMGIVLVGGFAVLMLAIVYQAGRPGATAGGEGAAFAPRIELGLGAGTSVSHLALDGGRMALHVAGPAGAEILVLDLATGQVLSRVRLRAP